jgi:hypothetical protein
LWVHRSGIRRDRGPARGAAPRGAPRGDQEGADDRDLGSLGLRGRTLFDDDGVAIGTVEELTAVLPATDEHRLLDRDAASNAAASTPRTAREPVIACGTAPAL